MLWILPCIIAAVFITGSLAISLSPGAHHNIAHLESTLRPQQLALYTSIRRERAEIYLWSLGIGLLAGLCYLALDYNSQNRCWSQSCAFVAIVLVVTHMAYILWPKTQYMVQILDSDAQRNAWVQVYRGMQLRQYGGMVVGAIGLAIFGKYGGC